MVSRAADILRGAGRVAVLSGAGISKESGIPTFREAQTGLWERYDPEELATPQAFLRNPDRAWSWYMYRRNLVGDAAPNPGHRALVDLEKLVGEVVILTQNVDGLHVRAGSRDVVELHGSLERFRCSAKCRGDLSLVDLSRIKYDQEHAPACPQCGARIRPDVVWFGESLPPAALSRAAEVASACAVMLVVGTSGVVQPAASLPREAKRAGAVIIEVNPQESEITSLADVFLRGPSGEVLPQIVNAMRRAA